jgi:hypothetical protein
MFKSSGNDMDLSTVFVNCTGKKTKTEGVEGSGARVVEVGRLFKYVFTVLKRGYLVKLRMERNNEKRAKGNGGNGGKYSNMNSCLDRSIAKS